MNYMQTSRPSTLRRRRSGSQDPMHGVANLFDVALVFIVALLLSLMAAFQVLDFFNPESDITVMKKVKDQWQIITKKGKEVTVKKMTDKTVGGDEGLKLGTAYRLKDGRVIYIPNEKESEKEK